MVWDSIVYQRKAFDRGAVQEHEGLFEYISKLGYKGLNLTWQGHRR